MGVREVVKSFRSSPISCPHILWYKPKQTESLAVAVARTACVLSCLVSSCVCVVAHVKLVLLANLSSSTYTILPIISAEFHQQASKCISNKTPELIHPSILRQLKL